jgi:AcrR family transcriptional regulator
MPSCARRYTGYHTGVTDALTSAPSLAQRKRQLVRDELAEAALKLLAWQGYEATTIDQIVAAAGVSRRTFFRYFESKEDVIVQFLVETGALMCAALSGRPAQEPPGVALRHALSVLVDRCVEHPEKSVRLTRLTLETPALLARFLERQAQWSADLTAELGRRSGLDPATDLRPALAAGVTLTAFHTALHRWAAGDGAEDLPELVDRALAVVRGALDALAGTAGSATG